MSYSEGLKYVGKAKGEYVFKKGAENIIYTADGRDADFYTCTIGNKSIFNAIVNGERSFYLTNHVLSPVQKGDIIEFKGNYSFATYNYESVNAVVSCVSSDIAVKENNVIVGFKLAVKKED